MLQALKKIRLRTPAKLLAAGSVFFLLIGFVENRQHAKRCTGLDIVIEDAYDAYFINDDDVRNLLTHNGNARIEGEPLRELNLKRLEQRLKTNKFVKTCQVYADLGGRLNIHIRQDRPIARIIDPQVPDAYISEDGHILPLSERFTARVPLLEGNGLRRLLKNDLAADSAGRLYFDLLKAIDNERFFKALIAQIHVDRDGHLRLYPQIGRQVIEFGPPADIAQKFEKIRIFYQKILPVQGWNRYRRVSVAYKNQIVCE